jgi:hypothetical protein
MLEAPGITVCRSLGPRRHTMPDAVITRSSRGNVLFRLSAYGHGIRSFLSAPIYIALHCHGMRIMVFLETVSYYRGCEITSYSKNLKATFRMRRALSAANAIWMGLTDQQCTNDNGILTPSRTRCYMFANLPQCIIKPRFEKLFNADLHSFVGYRVI